MPGKIFDATHTALRAARLSCLALGLCVAVAGAEAMAEPAQHTPTAAAATTVRAPLAATTDETRPARAQPRMVALLAILAGAAQAR